MWVAFNTGSGPTLVNMDRVDMIEPMHGGIYTRIVFSYRDDSNILLDVPFDQVRDALNRWLEKAEAKNTAPSVDKYAGIEFGRRIAMRMGELGMSQGDIARAGGLTPATVSRCIHNGQNPKTSTLIKLANALMVDPSEMLKWAETLKKEAG